MTNLVFIQGKKVVTDSLVVAREFGKQHKNVMRDIDETVKRLSEPKFLEEAREMGIQTGRVKFEHTPYVNEQNKQTYQKYLMNFDAFMLVTMSYTTQKAMLIKMKYMEEFNKMRNELAEQNKPSYMIDDPVKRAERWIEERKAVEADLKIASYAKHILESDGTVNISQIAEDYGMTGTEMNKTLHKFGIQYKSGKQWLLYAKHKGKGYTDSITMPIVHRDGSETYAIHTKWTQQGRMFIYETLKANGMLPVMEQRKLYLVERKGEKV